MRGSTVKKIRKFVKILIDNTPEEQRVKSKHQLVNEVKALWNTGPNSQTFIKKVVVGDFSGIKI